MMAVATSAMYWSYEKELLMIKYFEQHRYLWDTDHVLFHKRFPRLQGFAELVQLLGMDEATIRQRWSSMRSQFCREERKVQACNTYIPTWDHYHSLLFLRKPNEEQEIQEKNSEALLPQIIHVKSEANVFVSEDGHNGFESTRMIENEPTQSPNDNEERMNPLNTILESANQQNQFDIGSDNTLIDPQNRLARKFTSRAQVRRNRRWNAISSNRSMSDSTNLNLMQYSNTPHEKLHLAGENESFSMYITNVLNRFTTEKQRKCRNDILRIILKYDISDEEGIGSDVV